MVKLIPLTPCAGLLPKTVGTVTLTEVVVDQVTSVAPYAGKDKQVSAGLKEQVGVGLPGVGCSLGKGDALIHWAGHRTWFLRGAVSLDGLAAVTDQSDTWAIVEIAGAGAEDVLARLVPVDLRVGTFKKGHTARTLLGHMNVLIMRTGPQAFEIMAMRSMAGTLVHELEQAMRGVAARNTNF